MTAGTPPVEPRRPRIARDLATWRGPLILLATGISVVLGLVGLGARDLWLDEVTSVVVAQRFFQDFPFLSDVNMTFYYGLLAVWVSLVGVQDEAIVRLLSVAFAAASVPVVILIAERISDLRTAILAGFLLAVNGFAIRYAQEARGYSLVMLLTALSTLLFLEIRTRRSKALLVAYVLVSAMAIYTHFFAAFILLAHFVTIIVEERRRLDPVRLLVTYGAIGLVAAPALIGASLAGTCQIAYLQPPESVHILAAMRGIAGDAAISGVPDETMLWAGSALLAGTILCLVFAAIATVRARRTPLGQGRRIVWMWLALPFVVALVVSFLLVPVFAWRYLVVLVPPTAILVAIGLTSLRRPLAVAGTAVMLALAVATTIGWYRQPEPEPWREVVAHVADAGQPADAIVMYTPSVRKPIRHYALVEDRVAEMPVELQAAKAGCDPVESVDAIAAASPDLARLSPQYHARVWLVISHATNESASDVTSLDLAVARLNERYTEVDRRAWVYKEGSSHSIEVRLYQARDLVAAN